MKKIITISILFISIYNLKAQIIEDFKTDLEGEINYSKVIDVANKSKEELYSLSKIFFVNNFNSANKVIQLEDKDNSVIIGKGNSKIIISAGMGVYSTMYLNYSIKIESKENKIRYEIYNFSFDGQYGNTSVDVWFDKKNYYKKNGKPRNVNDQAKKQSLDIINSIELLLKNQFESELPKSKDW
jgi:hypothetical protein